MHDTEIWKAIPGYEGYEVSNQGRVRNRSTGYVLKSYKCQRWGYLRVNLSICGGYKTLRIHRLVAAAFLGATSLPEVNHIDGDKENNRPGNLEYVTRSENQAHAYANGLRKRHAGAQNPNAKLLADDVERIRGCRLTSRSLAFIYGVAQQTIRNLRSDPTRWSKVADTAR